MATCQNCGQLSPEGFQFCPHCGHRLAAAPPPRTERKVVTVLFCDLVGFTARSDGADPEDVRAILEPFHALSRREIERHGGTLEKFIGDAAMGVFGSPVAHEDDPERAVRAGLEIMAGIRVLNEGGGAEPLAVRIGVNTGEALVTLLAGVQEGENVAGDMVNTASRIQTAAPAGVVLVGEDTYQASRERIEYEALEPVSAKGKAEPLQVWRALAARPLTAIDRPARTPFVGRDLERALLEQALLRAIAHRATQLVTIVGEPGVGKSRLVSELGAAIPRLAPDTPVEWRRGRCLPYGEGITFWALGEVVKDQAGILDSDPGEERDRKLGSVLEVLVADPTERAWLRARLAALVGGEAGDGRVAVERDEAFTAWQRFLEAVARLRPLVIVFEDIHWADPAMLAFLEHLVERVAAVPLLLLATARPELYDRHPTWGAGMRNAAAVSIPPLSEEETATLVSNLLPAASLPPRTRALLLERSGGNPLYAEELARALHDRGVVDESGKVTKNLHDVEFPQTVQALIAARLDTLPPERKALLQDAAVIGRVFWSGAVAFVGDAAETEVREHLHELGRKELVRPALTSSIADQAEYSFWHSLTRDVAYGQITRAARAAKHRRAANWIESIGGERPGDVAEILVHHAISALDLVKAAGQTEGLQDLEGEAARYLRMAAARTIALDVARAEAQLRAALELTPSGHPDRPRVQASLAEAAFQTGRLDEAQQLYEQAISGLSDQGEVLAASDAMVRRSVVLEYCGETGAGRVLLADAIRLLSELPPSLELARALATSAGSAMIGGRYQDAVAQADRAIELAQEVGEVAAAARAHGFRGYVRAIHGDMGGVAEQREALDSLLALGRGRATAIIYNNLGSCLDAVEGPQAALDLFREAVTFAESRGLREMEMALQNAMLTALFEVGDWDEVLRLGQEVTAEARRQGSGHDEVFAEVDRAAVLAYRQGAPARELCESLLERARPLEDSPILVRALTVAAFARNASQDGPGTIALLREALEVTRGDGVVDRVTELPELLRLSVAAGDLVLAAELLDGTEEFGLERHGLAIMTARAVLAEATGEPEAALEAYQETARRWTEWGHALERAHSLYGAGRCLLALGRSADAKGQLSAAHDAFGTLGAEPVLAQIRSSMG